MHRLPGVLGVLALLFVAVRSTAQETAPFDHSHAAWTTILRDCVREDGIDYLRLMRERAGLDAYLATLRAVTPEELANWNREQRFAFWINAYNAHCVQRVIEHYPLESIRKLDGAFGVNTAFDKGFIPMRAHLPSGKGGELSLNDIAHEILRKRFKDARLHAALHNASKSGPPLLGEAYTAEALERQLDQQMRAFVNDPARNRIDAGKKELALSEVFKWFAEDFERDAKSVQAFVARYAPVEQAEAILGASLSYRPFEWALDDASR